MGIMQKIKTVLTNRKQAGEPLLQDGEWIEEILLRGRPNGDIGGHVLFGWTDGMDVEHTSPALPVKVLQGQIGLPIADILGAVAVAREAARESAEAGQTAAEEVRDTLAAELEAEQEAHAAELATVNAAHTAALQTSADFLAAEQVAHAATRQEQDGLAIDKATLQAELDAANERIAELEG